MDKWKKNLFVDNELKNKIGVFEIWFLIVILQVKFKQINTSF